MSTRRSVIRSFRSSQRSFKRVSGSGIGNFQSATGIGLTVHIDHVFQYGGSIEVFIRLILKVREVR